jgi:hypothetical protein
MVLVTVLAYLTQYDVQSNRRLLPILAIGKLTSSLTALAFYILDQRVFIYLVNFIVDGCIVVIIVGCLCLLQRRTQADAYIPCRLACSSTTNRRVLQLH